MTAYLALLTLKKFILIVTHLISVSFLQKYSNSYQLMYINWTNHIIPKLYATCLAVRSLLFSGMKDVLKHSILPIFTLHSFMIFLC